MLARMPPRAPKAAARRALKQPPSNPLDELETALIAMNGKPFISPGTPVPRMMTLLKMIDDNYAGKTDDRRKIWTVYSFLTWYDVYFVHDGEKPDVIAIA